MALVEPYIMDALKMTAGIRQQVCLKNIRWCQYFGHADFSNKNYYFFFYGIVIPIGIRYDMFGWKYITSIFNSHFSFRNI